MPEFLADPSVLTKEKLKSELIANNVSLPGGEQRKDVYVQLYLQHLTARNVSGVSAQPDFSSDEEREPTPVAVRNRGGSAAAVAVGRVSDLAILFISRISNGLFVFSSRPSLLRGRQSFPAFSEGAARCLVTD